MKARIFTAFALLTIGLTVGGVTTVFTVVDSIVLEPLPYPAADRLVRIEETNPGNGIAADDRSVAADDLADIRRDSWSFDIVAGYNSNGGYTFDEDTEPYRVGVKSVTPEVFSLLGAAMHLGSVPAERNPGLNEAVVSYDFWSDRLGASPSVIGSVVEMSRKPSWINRACRAHTPVWLAAVTGNGSGPNGVVSTIF